MRPTRLSAVPWFDCCGRWHSTCRRLPGRQRLSATEAACLHLSRVLLHSRRRPISTASRQLALPACLACIHSHVITAAHSLLAITFWPRPRTATLSACEFGGGCMRARSIGTKSIAIAGPAPCAIDRRGGQAVAVQQDTRCSSAARWQEGTADRRDTHAAAVAAAAAGEGRTARSRGTGGHKQREKRGEEGRGGGQHTTHAPAGAGERATHTRERC